MNNNYHPARANDGIDILSENPIIKDTKDRLYNDSQPAVDSAGQPAINTNTTMPSVNYGTGQYDARSGGYVPDGGTILSDNYYNVSDSGIHQVNNMSANSTDQWEARVANERQQLQRTGKSIYMSPPSSSGAPSLPIEADGTKPTSEQLAKLKVRDRLISLNSRLKTLTQERQVASLKLASIDRNLQSIKDEFEELENY